MKLSAVLGFLLCGVMTSSAWAAQPTVVPVAAPAAAPAQPVSAPYSTPAKNEPPFTLTQAGFQIGLNFSQITTNGTITSSTGTTGTDGHTGLVVGGQLEMSIFGNFLFLQPEFRLVQQGYALTGVSGSNVTVNYLEVPILAKVKFETTPGMHVFGLFGPNFGMKVGTTYDTFWGNGTAAPPINFWNFALDFGAGLEYDLTSSVNFFGEFRYSLGLSNVNGLAGSPLTEQFRAFQIITGLNFPL